MAFAPYACASTLANATALVAEAIFFSFMFSLKQPAAIDAA
jgi:hypothetical protein